MDNMKIYNAVRKVPAEAQKSFNNGSFSGTDINPMWRIKTLTEQFGPAGIGWYYEVLSERCEEHHDITMAIVDLNLYVKVDGEWSKPIYGTGGNKLVQPTKNGPKASDEGYKMALTDALSVACKALGIGADVYYDKDKTKYTAETEQNSTQNERKTSKQSTTPKTEENAPQAKSEPNPPTEQAQSKGDIMDNDFYLAQIHKLIDGYFPLDDVEEMAENNYGLPMLQLEAGDRKDLYVRTRLAVKVKKEQSHE